MSELVEILIALGVTAVVIGAIVLVVSVVCWVGQIYENKRNINAILHDLGFKTVDEKLNKLEKSE